jgi:BMFP domain-containing protein YqiC
MAIPPVQNNPPKQKRSRIVVNLDRAGDQGVSPAPQGGQPSGGQPFYGAGKRRRRWPIVLGSILLLLILGGFVFWQIYKTRPAYSLALLVDAAQRNDTATFDRVVDTGKVVESFAPQVVNEATGRLGTALTPQMRQRIEALVPTLIPNVTENLRNEVMKQVREVTARAEGKPFFLIALTIPYIVDIKQEGDTATVRAKRNDRDIELVMQRTPEKRWKVVSVKDDELARRVVDDIAKYLPAVGGDLENEIRNQIDKRLPGILPGGKRR